MMAIFKPCNRVVSSWIRIGSPEAGKIKAIFTLTLAQYDAIPLVDLNKPTQSVSIFLDLP